MRTLVATSLGALLLSTASVALALDAHVPPTSLSGESIVILPDTQYYSLRFPDVYRLQTEWIAQSGVREHVQLVAHMGDIVHENSNSEWTAAQFAHQALLDEHIPFTMIPGNHDNPERDSDDYLRRNTDKYNAHFGPLYYAEKEVFPPGDWGTMFEDPAAGNADNNYAKFTVNGENYLIVNLEFAARKDSLCWANELIEQEQQVRPSRVIVATHCYQATSEDDLSDSSLPDSMDGRHVDCTEKYRIIGSNGRDIWNELTSRHNNISLVLSGHVGGSEHRPLVSPHYGNTVWEILTDYQFDELLGVRAGNGWLKSLTFDGLDVSARTFTVLHDAEVNFFGLGPVAVQIDSFNDDPYPSTVEPIGTPDGHHTFSFTMDPLPPYLPPAPLRAFHDRTVNSFSSGEQILPAVAADATGRMIAVWDDNEDIRARSFGEDGCEVEQDRLIGTFSAFSQGKPQIAMNSSGEYVVVWEDNHDNNDYYQIYAAAFNADGSQKDLNPGSPRLDVTVNVIQDDQQLRPHVDINDNGEFVVVWEDDTDGNDFFEAYAASFDGDGIRRTGGAWGSGYRVVNADSDGQQRKPRVALSNSGDFVVAWEDDRDDNDYYQIYAAGFSRNGSKRVSDFTVNDLATGQQTRPDVAIDNEGNFVVTWQSNPEKRLSPTNPLNGRLRYAGQDRSMVAYFDEDGDKQWGDTVLGTLALSGVTAQRREPRVDYKASVIDGELEGRFAVAWQDDSGDDGWWQIKASAWEVSGDPNDPSIIKVQDSATVNTVASGQQLSPDVTVTVDDRVIVVWQDDVEKNDHYQIVARGFDLAEDWGGVIVPSDIELPDYELLGGSLTGDLINEQGGSQLRKFAGARARLFDRGFSEASTRLFETGESEVVGSHLLVDAFVNGHNLSGYHGAIQLYLSFPGHNLTHQYVGQAELSPLNTGQWNTISIPLPSDMKALLSGRNDAQLSVAVDTDAAGIGQVFLKQLRYGGDLEFHPDYDCGSTCAMLCSPTTASCDGDGSNGCEVNLADDVINCGGCGVVCDGTCSEGKCKTPLPVVLTDLSAEFSFQSDWGEGYCTDLVISNVGESVAHNWEVVFDIGDAQVNSSWNTTLSVSSGMIAATPVDWNAQIVTPGSTHSIGFCAARNSPASMPQVLGARALP